MSIKQSPGEAVPRDNKLSSKRTPEISLRSMREDDVSALCTLAREIWQLHYPGIITPEQIGFMLTQRYTPERLLDELAEPDIAWTLAIAEGRCEGFSSTHYLPETRELKLDKLYVHPNAQGRGLGGALIKNAESQGMGRGCKALVLAVNRDNSKAIDMYEHWGFAKVETRITDIGGGFVMDDFIMRRSLTTALTGA